MIESLTDIIEELGSKIISLKDGNEIDIVIDGNLTNSKEIRKLRKALDENDKPYNWTMKGSAYEKKK